MKAIGERLKPCYEFGSFRIDSDERLLLRAGRPVPVSPKAFDILLLLVENGGRLLSKDELISRIWPDTYVEEANLANNISLLRRVLGAGGDQDRYIETVPRRGYRFSAGVREVWGDGRARTGSRQALLGIEGAGYSAVSSIAVLPFKSLRSVDGDDYLGMAIADALITRLGNIRQIVVRPTSSVRRYARGDQDAIAAGMELKVDAVLEGSVRRFEGRFRVTVQLVSVRDQSNLWAKQFDGDCPDIFSIEDSISEQVANALSVELTGEQRRLLTRRYTESAEAYQSYLKGRYHWNKWTHEGFKKAAEHFTESIGKDPRFALAYTGLADAYGLLGLNGYMPTNEAMPRAEAAAETALELDDELAEAYMSLGAIKCFYRWDLTGARRLLRRSLELNPNFALAHQVYSLYLTAMGRPGEALGEIKLAEELDPLSLALQTTEAFILCAAGRYDKAIERSFDTLDMKPKFYPAFERLGEAYELTGNHDKAIEAFKRATTLSKRGLFPLAALGHAYAVSGHAAEAEAIVEELRGRVSKDYVLAWVYAGLGLTDRAFGSLEEACQQRDSQMVYLKVDRKFDAIRSDPRMEKLAQRVGLVLYPVA